MLAMLAATSQATPVRAMLRPPILPASAIVTALLRSTLGARDAVRVFVRFARAVRRGNYARVLAFHCLPASLAAFFARAARAASPTLISESGTV